MMKKTLSFLFLFLTVGLAYSQSLEFVYKDKALTNNEKITITDFNTDFGDVELEFKALIRNKTNKDVKVVVTKEVITPAEGSSNELCTSGGCSEDDKSQEYMIKAKGVDEVFHGAFRPTKASTATIKYTATVVGTDDAVSVTVTYQYAPTGIEQVGYQTLSISQQNRIVTINYQNAQDTNLQIVDLLGNIVGTYKLSANTNSMNIDLTPKSGLFLFVFSNKKSRFTQKYIIK